MKRNVDVDNSSSTSSKTRFWSRAAAFFVQYVLVDDYIDPYIETTFLNESLSTCSPPHPSRPAPKDIDQPSQTDRAVSTSSCLLINSADIRFRDGKWMVSRDLENEESIFIQFPLLEEDEGKSQGGAEANAQASPRITSFKRNEPKKGARVQQRKKGHDGGNSTTGGSLEMMTPTENDNEKEWYPL